MQFPDVTEPYIYKNTFNLITRFLKIIFLTSVIITLHKIRRSPYIATFWTNCLNNLKHYIEAFLYGIMHISYLYMHLFSLPYLQCTLCPLQLLGHRFCRLAVTAELAFCSVEFKPTKVTHCCREASTWIAVMSLSPVT